MSKSNDKCVSLDVEKVQSGKSNDGVWTDT